MGLDDAEVRWLRSSASVEGNCVEVAATGGIAVRDSNDPDGASVGFSAYAWRSFLSGLKDCDTSPRASS
ncbi:DUF397 domain-containing protein [Streptomyces sp. NPDC057621]|uniref:DUF397 domain-containing protein n=1 Tax=Streptomyces liliiviolaceus TaxID=2823109 RepID=A0A941B527_9ACTN|nr:DUF397 domain-containing protein [Streptomyces liliiviolaceus]MBQ0847766.1 DUF397 domain-containing protein [Streptomyces liliiviolaceus]